jgi:hypothetical protein
MKMQKMLLFVALAAGSVFLTSLSASAQKQPPEFGFRSGQAVYIVAFRDTQQFVADETTGTSSPRTVKESYLDLEKKVDEQVRKWGYFHVVERLSDAELIMLVYTDMSSMEGLVVSPDDFRQHYKERFDLDQLRDVAYARGTAGPLNIPTLTRLSERMIKQLREKIAGPAH